MTKIDAFFNNFNEIEAEILRTLNKSKKSIHICMAWFTNAKIMTLLIEKLSQGIDVHICLLIHPSNFQNNILNNDISSFKVNISSFLENEGKLYPISTGENLLHHKFAIIDNEITITGSYNWTVNAKNNLENIVIIHDTNIAKQFVNQFNSIVYEYQSDLLSENMRKCSHHNCGGYFILIEIVDQSTIHKLRYCTSDISHTKIVKSRNNPDEFSYLIQDRVDCLNDHCYDDTQISNPTNFVKRKVERLMSNLISGDYDIFKTEIDNKVMGRYNITQDIEDYIGLSIVWEHELIKDFSISDFENEILSILDDC